MAENLTGQKVSFTYGRLIQKIDSSYYDGFGNPILIPDASFLSSSLVNYIKDTSLNDSQFFWNNGRLDISVIGGSGVSIQYVDASLSNIRATYVPDVSLNDSYFKWVNGLLEPSILSGSGDVTKTYVDASLLDIRSTYLPDASLSGEFTWSGGRLYVDVSVVQNGASLVYVDGSLALRDSSINWLYENRVDPSLDYDTYSPKTSDSSFYYDGDSVTSIYTTNSIGTKIVNFVYDGNGDVSTIFIDNYGTWQKEVFFKKDVNDNVLAVYIK